VVINLCNVSPEQKLHNGQQKKLHNGQQKKLHNGKQLQTKGQGVTPGSLIVCAPVRMHTMRQTGLPMQVCQCCKVSA